METNIDLIKEIKEKLSNKENFSFIKDFFIIQKRKYNYKDILMPDGKIVNLSDLEKTIDESFNEEYIMKILKNIKRFSSRFNTDEVLTVYEHSLLVAFCVEEKYEKTALFHDSAEIIIGDINKIIKDYNFQIVENNILLILKNNIKDFIYPFPKEVKDADKLVTEFELEYLTLDSKLKSKITVFEFVYLNLTLHFKVKDEYINIYI